MGDVGRLAVCDRPTAEVSGGPWAPRLLAAFGSQRDRYASATEVQKYSGIAPVTERSGRRNGCTSAGRVPNSAAEISRMGGTLDRAVGLGRVPTTSDSASAARNTMPR